MTKKVCISGYYGFDNFGDETILKILVENLKDYDVTVFSSSPEKTSKTLNVDSVHSFKIKDVIAKIKQCDCLISGGGSLLQDVTSIKSLIYYLGIIFIAQVFRKQTIIFAQGIGPVNNKLMAKLTFWILKNTNKITVRDDKSLNLLKNQNIDAIKCADPVWNITVQSQKTDKIGVQLRDFNTLNEDFILQLANFLNKNYQNKKIYIYSLQNKLDLEVCSRLKAKLNNAIVVENTSNEKLIKELSSLDTLIAMRYHACLIAIKSNVKLLPINYDIKVEQLAQDFDLECLSLSDLSKNEEIFEKFKQKTIHYNKDRIETLKFNFKDLFIF